MKYILMLHLLFAMVSCADSATVLPSVEEFPKEKYLLRYLKKEVKSTLCKPAIESNWAVIVQAANCGNCDVRTLRILEQILELNSDGYIIFSSKQQGSEKIDSTIKHQCIYFDEGNFSKYGLYHKENYFFQLQDSTIKHWAYLTEENADSIYSWLRK